MESFLAKKYNIVAPSHKALDLMDAELTSDFFSKHHFDVVIHAAGKPGHRNIPDPTSVFYSDMLMFMNLMHYKKQWKKMIVLSSGAVYDQRYPIVKVKEEDYRLRVPVDEHALYRRVTAELVENIENVVELRLFGIFGKYEDYAIRFISNAICKTLFNLPITIKQDKKLDYLYIEDLMPILDYFIGKNVKYKAYNVTSDESVSLSKLAGMIKEISGKNLPVKIAQKGMGLEYSGGNFRLKGETKNLQLTPIGQAIKDLYIWYSEHKNTLKKELLLKDK